MSVYLTVHFLKAMTAYELALEQNHIVSVAAKQASRFVFFENNLVLVNENFNLILVFNIHFVAQFNWQHNSSKFVNSSYDTSTFHGLFLLSYILSLIMQKWNISSCLYIFYHVSTEMSIGKPKF